MKYVILQSNWSNKNKSQTPEPNSITIFQEEKSSKNNTLLNLKSSKPDDLLKKNVSQNKDKNKQKIYLKLVT